MGTDMFPSIKEPSRSDRVGAENADEQLNLVFGLRDVRLDRDMSIVDVAEAMGVDASQVSRFESGGTNPTMATVRRYAKAVGAVFRVQVRRYEVDHRERVRHSADNVLMLNTDDQHDTARTKAAAIQAPPLRYVMTR
ncbi:helix-turn-helix transcriptional regulator [Tsukamurella tyrosinosolvens]|uniref:helix-turn-helix domain-containing protein n=1 Tax=Tsukamurella tyrosinosolvens TaxID=57704 RepID=UPI001CE1375B|nr:helix-turn-helix transcriptional regulator [Tsukamurella tyrosinosolvens]MCA4997140.1 helix-turn-helix transcriptional regulator [Tsukamurella tyrosinosolvens]